MKELFIEITEIESNKFIEFDLPYHWFIDNDLIFRLSELEKYEER
jgi:hypothetical protein